MIMEIMNLPCQQSGNPECYQDASTISSNTLHNHSMNPPLQPNPSSTDIKSGTTVRKSRISYLPLPPNPDFRLAIGYGSAWHLLRCLGWQRERFNALIASKFGAKNVRWLDFPGYTRNQCYPSSAPIRDGEWKRLDFMEDEQVREAYEGFWPARGEQQNWDAIGGATIDRNEEWLLVEAKAHKAEIGFHGTTASEAGGRPQIRAAFRETLEALGYGAAEASRRAEDWLNGCYQYANRLATLHFLMKQGIQARLIFLYFCGDKRADGKAGPANANEWQASLDMIYDNLGLEGASALEERVHTIFLNVDLA
jgi:hypothetical protein